MSIPLAQWRRHLAAARAGCNSARGQLLDSQRAFLLVLATTGLASDLRAKADAADLVQDALLEALIAFDQFIGHGPQQFRSWLRGILLHNLANFRRHYRHTSRRNVRREIRLNISSHQNISTLLHAPRQYENHSTEYAHHFLQALDKIPNHYRAVIVWHINEGRTFADIAGRLGRSPAAARQLWVRAKQRVCNKMASPI